MEKSYYKEYYHSERRHWWFRARAFILKSYIERHIGAENMQILNVGAATGATTEWLSQLGEVTSIEYDEDCVALTRDKTGLTIQHGDIRNLQFPDNRFDLVCCFDVVEHVDDDALAVRELQRVCKPDGSVLITVPAYMHLWSDHDVINHHHRRYNRKQLLSLFDPSELVYASYFNALLYPLVLAARTFSNLKKKVVKGNTVASDLNKVNEGLVSNVFYAIFKSESRRINRQRKFPFGVSLIVHSRKIEPA